MAKPHAKKKRKERKKERVDTRKVKMQNKKSWHFSSLTRVIALIWSKLPCLQDRNTRQESFCYSSITTLINSLASKTLKWLYKLRRMRN